MAECAATTGCGSMEHCKGCASNQRKGVGPAVEGGPARHVLFVMSGKGGVGKSAVTVNLAAALSARGHSVGILDVDLHGPSVPALLGLRDRLTAVSAERLRPARYDGRISVVSMDSLLAERDTAVIWRGPRKASAIRQFVHEVDWDGLDYLLIDSPPGTGDEHLAVIKEVPGVRCIMVTTPQEISLADVRKALDFVERANAPLLGLVENMSGLACPHCGGGIDLFSTGGGEKLARERGIPFLGRVPVDPAMLAAADRGVPVVDLTGQFAAKDAFLTIAAAVEALAEQPRARADIN